MTNNIIHSFLFNSDNWSPWISPKVIGVSSRKGAATGGVSENIFLVTFTIKLEEQRSYRMNQKNSISTQYHPSPPIQQ